MRFQCSECRAVCDADGGDAGGEVACAHCGVRVAVPANRLSPGAIVGDCCIRGPLGEGERGLVFRVDQTTLDRPAALRVLRPEYREDGERVREFVRGVRNACRLNHMNIVQGYGINEDEGILFFAMELLEGRTLEEVLAAEGRLPAERVLAIGRDIAGALDHAWTTQQLLHRAVNPKHIFVTDAGPAKLFDWELARTAEEMTDEDQTEPVGRPEYCCPPALWPSPPDVRGDIYSLGACLYHAVTGRVPFAGESVGEILRRNAEEDLPSPKELAPDLPDSLCAVLLKMLAKNPDDRHADAQELLRELDDAG